MDAASNGLSARPVSAKILIAAVSPIALQAGGTDAPPSGLPDITKWGSIPGKCERLDDGRSDPASTTPSPNTCRVWIEIAIV